MPAPLYPFVTRKQMTARLAADNMFVIEMLVLLYERFITRDPQHSDGAMGWSCSEKLKAETLWGRFANGDVGDKDIARASTLLKRYSRQIARALRDAILVHTTDPTLLASAAVFGVGPFARTQASPAPKERTKRTRTTNEQATKASENQTNDPTTPLPTPPGVVRRRGAPGSRNKPQRVCHRAQTTATGTKAI